MYATNIKWTNCGDIKPGNTPTTIHISPLIKSTDKEVIKNILQDKYGFGIESFELSSNINNIYRVDIKVTQKLSMQLKANSILDAFEKAHKLTDNGTYAVLNDNCYESYITVDHAQEIDNEQEVDRLVVEDNEDYYNDLTN